MSNRILKVKPGYLVTLSTAIRGGVQYDREDLNEERRPDGAEVEEWKTVKVTADPEEHERAVQTRSRVRALFKSATVWTPFGSVCPSENLPDLDAAMEEAERIVREFNAGAQHCEVRFASLRGEIAENSAEAVRAIRSEVGELLRDYEQMIRAGDIRSARDIATRATQMNRLLEQESAGSSQLSRAIQEGRKVARAIVRRVEKGGEELAEVLAEANLSPIAEARFVFLSGPDTEEEPGVDPETGIVAGETEPSEAGETEHLPHLRLPEPETVQIEEEPEDEFSEQMRRDPEDRDPGTMERMIGAALEHGGDQGLLSEEPEPEDDALPAVDSGRFSGLLDPAPTGESDPSEDPDDIPF